MGWIIKLFRSSVGAKVLMAVTGVALVGFVLAHLAGNLQIYIGREAFNSYAFFLKSKPGLVWAMRLGIIIAALLHILSGLRLAALNRAARGPEGYRKKRHRRAGLFGRSMPLSGLTLLAFIVYHLMHFTLGIAHRQNFERIDALGRHDVYGMFVLGFQNPLISATYVLAMVLLGMHLSHGITSMFQSIGLTAPKYRPLIDRVGPLVSLVVVAGNISMPVAVLTGYITL